MFTILLLCFAGFLAAIIDAIAGGGGLITIPAYLMAGVPPHMALGTNKLCATCSSLTSCFNFAQSGKVNLKLFKILAPFSLLGAILGVHAVMIISSRCLNIIVLILLVLVALFTLFCKNVGLKNNFHGLNTKNIILGIVLSFALGFYTGFFGPGTGAFMMIGLIGVFKFDFIGASGNSKSLTTISNLASLILFAFNRQINYKLAIPVSIAMIIGAKLGTKIALNKGSRIIKPVFTTISLLVAIKVLYQAIA
ncbi:sulfite exporter TauE/SafE family protein [Clostridium sp. FAM 1755]|uniref:Probable membrane transporter protein n=1 Tax=Clostridium sporogenes TaxID=1509 RepID=A0AAE4JSM6_CLOSG|nr:TSUP family transporter [Clostridium sporogenes]MDS1003535.1 TSUP family transporter [Clostridium sporogenes]